ncbi:MAG: B12-binding domain-containing protein [Nitrosopumilus sp.]|uniref:Cobalamin B12-binding domain-containing protein n=2 Tax=Candidatus Nitrosomaritimum aestuariumsis TaxID=3342354 RepID=A0AC60VXN6_9ARCH|nr:cobalamin B12-binding domain-containing protein [Nitrosopumilaceae archaeon]MBA4459755.1 cobalamin B12-binding domain-containing protein [Nitrosopumilaceae archaeon]MBA4461977.1 cobalamin B12-binding domain-containing protein [Nitrosopumilaceae archaeon]MBA4462994.1 cobalamin B12-binding domain-containing protein [Nitrosopumilaceae archaeon]
MVYIRAKKIKGDQYLYLVKSVWDKQRNTSKQEIVKYLGKASEVVRDDIPPDYRENPKILSFLAAHNPEDVKKREDAMKKSKEQLYKKFIQGDVRTSLKVYEDFVKLFSSSAFFDKILRPVMYQIGDEWATNKISIAAEHVASNVAQALVKIIMDRNQTDSSKKKVLICVPQGEEHRLGCDVLETFLSTKGFRVFNLANSAPNESVLSYIETSKPDVVFVSITLEDSIKAGQRLVKKIAESYELPIFVGGFALQNEKTPKFDGTVLKDIELEKLPRIIKAA